MTDIADLRREYASRALDEQGADADPIAQFGVWFSEALKAEPIDTNAMTLATVSASGEPSARTVLVKGFDEAGFVFFTNYDSDKGRDLAANARASLLFYWRELERQVRINGAVTRTSTEESPGTRTLNRARSRAGSAQSSPRKAGPSPAAAISKHATPKRSRSIRTAACRGRRRGAVTASSPIASSSGRDARAGSTIGCST